MKKGTTATIFNDTFLLETKLANTLYHSYAAGLPIIDYHNHLSPKAIAKNSSYDTLTDIWLTGDHYKYRAMRANGVDEKFITGDASDYEKFAKWAETVPYTLRNPLYHWTHLELKNYFGITTLLDADSAESIYNQASELLKKPEYSVKNLLRKMNVKVVGTTDDPTDDLHYHKKIKRRPF